MKRLSIPNSLSCQAANDGPTRYQTDSAVDFPSRKAACMHVMQTSRTQTFLGHVQFSVARKRVLCIYVTQNNQWKCIDCSKGLQVSLAFALLPRALPAPIAQHVMLSNCQMHASSNSRSVGSSSGLSIPKKQNNWLISYNPTMQGQLLNAPTPLTWHL